MKQLIAEGFSCKPCYDRFYLVKGYIEVYLYFSGRQTWFKLCVEVKEILPYNLQLRKAGFLELFVVVKERISYNFQLRKTDFRKMFVGVKEISDRAGLYQ